LAKDGAELPEFHFAPRLHAGIPGVAPPCAACSIRDMSICGALETDELAKLAAVATTSNISGDQTIFQEGDPAEALFNVTGGTVKLYKLLPDGRRQITGFLFPGDFLGIAAADIYAYTAEAVGPVKLCRFPRGRFERLLEDIPHLERQLLSVASNELAQAQDQMLLLGRKSAKEKIASFLLLLERRQVQRGGEAAPVAVPMSRADIADYLGLTTETVSRTITQLKTVHTIRLLAGGKIELVDHDGLEELAEGMQMPSPAKS